MVSYRIDASARHAHFFQVALIIDAPAAEQRLSLPVWIPGSYLVREFARHLSMLTAEQGGRPLPLQQLDKATWAVRCTPGEALTVSYRVHAFDLSVRAAFLDASRGFFNGTSVCLRVEGSEAQLHGLTLTGLADGWAVATTLEPAMSGAGGHSFTAPDYDTLVDHPVELGQFWRGSFTAAGVAHEFVVAGALPDFDGERLLADAARICTAAIAFWHGIGPPPFERYLFMLNAVEEGRGGLEHRSSTALVSPRRDLPRKTAGAETSDGYADVLGLIAHEYFHAWNVKRLRPGEFASFDYTRENYTELLWFFEGFTSYYDDLLVLRSGLIDAPRYLKLLAKTLIAVAAAPGREVQSVAASSFDAWVKYYRADENTPNATISYYLKGSLVALALDLTLRSEGHGSLDDVMRRLWQTSGGGPIDEAAIAAALEAVGRRSYARELAAWVHGTGELPVEALLESAGVALERQAPTMAQRLGVRVSESALTGVKVSHVLRGGAGEAMGLAAGDELLAVAGWRLRRLDDAARFLAASPGSPAAPILVGRDQRVFALEFDTARMAGNEAGSVQLKLASEPPAATLGLREAWLAG